MKHRYFLNKWQFVFEQRDVVEMMVPLLSELMIGVYRLTDLPEQGERLQKKHYDGFLITVRFYKWFEIR